jgi:hypothetical protein
MSLFLSLFNVEDRSCFQGGTKFLNNITSNHMVFVLYITIQNNTSTIMAKSNNRQSTTKGGVTKANIGKKKMETSYRDPLLLLCAVVSEKRVKSPSS